MNQIDLGLQGWQLVFELLPTDVNVNLYPDGSFDLIASGVEESFDVKVTDEFGQSVVATISINAGVTGGVIDPGEPTPGNSNPIANKDKYIAELGNSIWGNVLDNDTDVDGDTLTATLKSGPSHGTISFNPDGSFDYIPNAGFVGDDVFEYTVTDGHGGMSMGEACIHIGPPIDPPEIAFIGDRIWFDTNGNGLQDPDEAGAADVTVQLKDGNGYILATQQTDANGYYLFGDLGRGQYSVGIVLPEGYSLTAQDVDGNGSDYIDSDFNPATNMTSVISLVDGEVDLTLDGGLVVDTPPATASLGDRIWFDSNGNGLQDPGEAGAADVTVQLKDGNGNVVDSQQTDANGNYLFDNLTAGQYSVGVVVPDGYVLTTQDAAGNGADGVDSDFDPAMNMTQVVMLAEGEQNLTLDGGLIHACQGTLIGVNSIAEGTSGQYKVQLDAPASVDTWFTIQVDDGSANRIDRNDREASQQDIQWGGWWNDPDGGGTHRHYRTSVYGDVCTARSRPGWLHGLGLHGREGWPGATGRHCYGSRPGWPDNV